MKKYLLLSILALLSAIAKSQIGGLSPEYVNAASGECIDPLTAEFEPSLSIIGYSSFFDDKRNITTLDTLQYDKEYGFRLTYGVSKGIEMGVFTPSSLNYLNYGIKINLLHIDKIHISALAGLNLDFTAPEIFYNSTIGFAVNYFASENFVSVFNSHFSTNFNNDYSIHIISDNAYNIGNYSLILSLIYNYYKQDQLPSDNFILCPSFMITAQKFYITTYIPLVLYGRNTEKTYGAGLALTMLID